ncbi:MAG: hypothetical protein ACM3PP_12120 [Candidatus Saccharibacteria bacterium]
MITADRYRPVEAHGKFSTVECYFQRNPLGDWEWKEYAVVETSPRNGEVTREVARFNASSDEEAKVVGVRLAQKYGLYP